MNDCPRQNPAYRPTLFLPPCRTSPPLLTCSDSSELELPSTHSVAMYFSPALRPDESDRRQKWRPGTTWRLAPFCLGEPTKSSSGAAHLRTSGIGEKPKRTHQTKQRCSLRQAKLHRSKAQINPPNQAVLRGMGSTWDRSQQGSWLRATHGRNCTALKLK
jgi:hypothetical protein